MGDILLQNQQSAPKNRPCQKEISSSKVLERLLPEVVNVQSVFST